MTPENTYILLDIIQKNGSVNRLTNNGMSYEEVAKGINYLITEKLIEYKNEKIVLSENGNLELKKLEIIFKKKNKNEWILPYEKGRIAKLEKNFIFVPKQNDLTF
jgi:hypothetical protein